MKNYLPILSVVALVASCVNTPKSMIPSDLPDAPIAIKQDSVITFHGHSRIDPYFWMRLSDEQKNAEIPDAQTQKVLDYLDAENSYTAAVMTNTEQLQESLYEEIVGKIKKDDESVPYLNNGYWYYTRYEEGKEYPIVCRKEDKEGSLEQIMLDVNTMAEGKDYYSASGFRVSPDNKILAFFDDELSRRIYTLRFKDLESGEMLGDTVVGAQAGGAWAADSKTFFYVSKNPITLLSEKIWRHTLSDDQSKDAMVYQEKDETNYIGVGKTKSGEYIVISSSNPVSSDMWILDANTPNKPFKQFTPRREDHEYYIDHHKNKFYIVSNDNAENFKLMECDENNTNIASWKEVIPMREDVMISNIDLFENHLVITEKSNALNQVKIIDLSTKEEHYLAFGEEVYVASPSTNMNFETDILRYSYSSLTTPPSTVDYNMNSREKEVKKTTEVVGGHNPNDYEAKRLWATSRDGVKVPISIVYKKGVEFNGTAPLLLYAYGSYGYGMDAGFNTSRLSLLDRGFIYAIAHIRGGDDMGRGWYLDGKILNKINTFNDFIDCSKYLIDNNYTSSEHLYAEGGSAGGLLMGAVANMAPELYNGMIAAVPFVDVVNTMLDETIPLTTNEFDEWGNPKVKKYYDYILQYSPYDNVEAKEYPNMLITTGYFDSQVQYWEPLKWIAKLRDTKSDENILILHADMVAGHGGASGRFKAYKSTALKYAFLLMLESDQE